MRILRSCSLQERNMLSPSEGREGRDNTSFPCRGNSQCVNMCELKVPEDGDGGM